MTTQMCMFTPINIGKMMAEEKRKAVERIKTAERKDKREMRKTVKRKLSSSL